MKLSQLVARDEHWIFGIKIAIPVTIPNGNVLSLVMNPSEYTLAFSCFSQRWAISAWERTKPMEGKKETFGPNLMSMMFTYRLGGPEGKIFGSWSLQLSQCFLWDCTYELSFYALLHLLSGIWARAPEDRTRKSGGIEPRLWRVMINSITFFLPLPVTSSPS